MTARALAVFDCAMARSWKCWAPASPHATDGLENFSGHRVHGGSVDVHEPGRAGRKRRVGIRVQVWVKLGCVPAEQLAAGGAGPL